MKLLTLNTHSWREENADEKLMYLAEAIVAGDYDIIALQEVNQMLDAPLLVNSHLRENNFMLALIEAIKEKKGPRYQYYWEASKCLKDYYEEGSSILVKGKIVEQEVFTVSTITDHTAPKKRNIVRVTAQIEDTLIDIYSCHLGWWHDEIEPFKPQCDRLMEKVRPERLSFLMGDFNNNANLRNEGYDYLMGHQLVDTYTLAKEKDSGATVQGEIAGWQGNKADLRIDLILVNQSLEVSCSKVIFNGNNKQVVSDHYGVEAIVEIK